MRRRERGFIQMTHVVIFSVVYTMLTLLIFTREPGGSTLSALLQAALFFVVTFVGAGAAVWATADAPYADPGSLGCFATSLPLIALITAGALGGRAAAHALGHAGLAGWLLLLGAATGMAIYAMCASLVVRRLARRKATREGG